MSGWKKIGGGGRNGRDPKHANRHRAKTPIPSARQVSLDVCKCDHLMVKHAHVNLGGDTEEYGNCRLCPCRTFRRKAA